VTVNVTMVRDLAGAFDVLVAVGAETFAVLVATTQSK